MELHRPKEEKTPFVCQLTFTAAGGMHGDIVQVKVNIPKMNIAVVCLITSFVKKEHEFCINNVLLVPFFIHR
jgi:hypothetical protein